MAIQWADFRESIRRSILRDLGTVVENPGEVADVKQRWGDEMLVDFIGWALNTFCAHTALAKRVVYNDQKVRVPSPDPITNTPPAVLYNMSADVEFDLPSDMYETPDTSGTVYTENVSANRNYLLPRHLGETKSHTFEVYGSNILRLNSPVGSGVDLVLSYFAYYPIPVEDTDLVLAPNWSHAALSYLVGYHALTQFAIRSANIRQWAETPEKGSPEHNSLRVQQKFLWSAYENELAKYPRQVRGLSYDF